MNCTKNPKLLPRHAMGASEPEQTRRNGRRQHARPRAGEERASSECATKELTRRNRRWHDTVFRLCCPVFAEGVRASRAGPRAPGGQTMGSAVQCSQSCSPRRTHTPPHAQPPSRGGLTEHACQQTPNAHATDSQPHTCSSRAHLRARAHTHTQAHTYEHGHIPCGMTHAAVLGIGGGSFVHVRSVLDVGRDKTRENFHGLAGEERSDRAGARRGGRGAGRASGAVPNGMAAARAAPCRCPPCTALV